MKQILLFIVSIFIIASCASPVDESPIDSEVNKMIGQMLMIGFRGYRVDKSSPVVKDIIAGRYVGVSLEIDEDFDYQGRIKEIYIELVNLQADASDLQNIISENFKEL